MGWSFPTRWALISSIVPELLGGISSFSLAWGTVAQVRMETPPKKTKLIVKIGEKNHPVPLWSAGPFPGWLPEWRTLSYLQLVFSPPNCHGAGMRAQKLQRRVSPFHPSLAPDLQQFQSLNQWLFQGGNQMPAPSPTTQCPSLLSWNLGQVPHWGIVLKGLQVVNIPVEPLSLLKGTVKRPIHRCFFS